MRVTIGAFARSGIENQLDAGLVETVETAILHYTGKLQSDRRPIAPPPFLGTSASADFGTGTNTPAQELEALELKIDSETEAVLRREAMRCGTDVDAIAQHSV